MQKFLIYALGLAMSLGATGVLANAAFASGQAGSDELNLATDGGFRDGLYVGRLMAEQGRPMLAPVGRWSTDRDRASFVAGYRQGYEAFVSAADKKNR